MRSLMKSDNGGVVARKLALHTPLDANALDNLGAFLGQPHRFEAGAIIAHAGDPADMVSIIEEGVACRMSVLPGGSRQISSIALCELIARMEAMGVGSADAYPFPFTQQDIADMQGLSIVHVNRVLQQLRGRDLAETKNRQLRILNWPGLAAAGLFDAGYLHVQSQAYSRPA